MPIRATGGLRAGVLRLAGGLLVGAVSLGGCAAQDQGSNADPSQVDATTPPLVGGCRMLTPGDLTRPSNATATVPCSEPHTAETFAVGTLPAEFADAAFDDLDLAAFAYQTCGRGFQEFLGADESLAMRTVLSWTMYRPSESAWSEGARWYRCDAVGGGPNSTTLLSLPDSTRGLLQEPDDAWLACVQGRSVSTAPRVPCSRRHTFRAVTTIKVGKPDDEYPGDAAVEDRTRGFCSDSVAAWLGYPANYSFAFTWFTELDWEAGNRRSVCWARTDQ